MLVDSVADYAIFMLDASGVVLTWNLGAERIKGYAAPEIIGRHFSVFYPAQDLAAGKPDEELKVAVRDGRVEDEGWRVRRDGTLFWANVVITALRDDHGGLLGFAKVTRDLTEKRAAAEELRRSEERFRLLLEGVGDYAIYMLDPQGTVSTWNAGAKKIKGYEPSEVIGRHYSLFFAPEDRAAGHPEAELTAARVDGRFEEEGWRVRKDGTRFWAGVVLTPLRSATGELLGFAKITRDLTTNKQAEEVAQQLLREQAARTAAEEAEGRVATERERYKTLSRRLEVIFESIADGITVQDTTGAIVFANSAAASVCGFSSVEEFQRTPSAEVFARFDITAEAGGAFDMRDLPARGVLAGGESGSVTLQVRERATDRRWWTTVRASPVRSETGQTEFAVSIWHDVSGERRRQEQGQYLASATATLASSLEYGAMLRALAGVLVPGLADWCSVHVLEGNELVNVAVAHVDPARVAESRDYSSKYPPDRDARSGLWNVIRSGRAELYPEITEEMLKQSARDEEDLRRLSRVGMKSVMVVPVRRRNHVIGVMALVSAELGRRYDALDLELAEELGRRAGTAIENAELYSAEKRARAQVELIAQAGEAFSATLDYETTLRNIVRIVIPALADFAFFDVIEGAEVRRFVAAHEPAAEAMLMSAKWLPSTRDDKNLCALSSGCTGFHPLIDDAWRRDAATSLEHLELLRRLELGSLVTVPSGGAGSILGALTVCFGKSGRHHTSDDVRLAEELARRAGVAVTQARLFAAANSAADTAAEALHVAEEASRIKDEFLATVSHELRTPLNAIVGWSSLLRARSHEPQTSKGLDVIFRNAQSQAKIIDDILDVSRIITGKLRLELTPVDIGTVVQDALEVVRPSADAKRITLEAKPSGQVSIVADPERIQQVVWNLLSNAIKFTDAGGKVEIRTTLEGDSARVEVQDSGRGIESAFLPQVFDRFIQADSSTTRRIGGLGLGLAIVRHIVELHGGQVTATSDGLGKGATFSFCLPIRAVVPALEEPGTRKARSSAGGTPTPVLSQLHVLVVDDEPDARELLSYVLRGAGATVSTAGSAAEAFALVHSARPDVIISDIGMPDEDGYGLMQRIRALDSSGGGTTPALALTAYARAEDRAKAIAAGFTTHIGKPVNPEELVAVVAKLGRS
ncbi:MAG: PAS domain S-box protein [Polyangiaceae bacterium]